MFTVTPMQKSGRPTLRDVAAFAGVSHMTVSRVVRGDCVVAAETTARVERAIEKLGYVPDPALSALAVYRTGLGRGHDSTLAFLQCDTGSYSDSVYTGARLEAERLGYKVEPHLLPPGRRQQDRLWRQLYHRGIRGVMVGPPRDEHIFPQWDWTPFATVLLSAIFRQPELHAVTTDYFSGAARAVQYLRSQGVKRAGFAVNPTRECRTAHRWLGGYLTALEGQAPAIFTGNPTSPQAARRWMKATGVDGLITIHRKLWEGRPYPELPTIFLNHFDCPAEVPCMIYDSRKIGEEGVRLIHHLYLNHEFGLPAEVKVVNLQPKLRLPEKG